MKTERVPSKKAIITGWILSGLAILFLLMDSIMKLIKPKEVVQGTLDLGYPESTITGIGVTLLISTIIYAVPRFSFFGAILLTGYLGGAIASHVRLQNPLFTHTLFPVYLALLIWIGLYLRDIRLRDLVNRKNPVKQRDKAALETDN
jgi:hypothetical protein